MDWWNELWLNEGFATWVGWLAVDHFYPGKLPFRSSHPEAQGADRSTLQNGKCGLSLSYVAQEVQSLFLASINHFIG